MFISPKVALLLLFSPFSTAQQPSLCDKYTTALFKDNTEDNQLKLLTTLVNRVVGGNFTATPNGKPVTGILVKSTFNGQPVDMLPKFIGTSGPTTNINGVATAGINFLDGGGADALKQGKPANDPNTRQFKLLTHLYGVFGSLTGCSKMGGSVFPNYAGNPSMTDTHRFMNINKPTLDFFIDQVGQAAVSLGVTPEDATAVGKALNSLFNTQCAKPTKLTPQSTELPQGFCFGEGCPVANPVDNISCPTGPGSFPNNGKTSSSESQPSGSSSGQQSLCDKYTTALFKDNTEDNQLKLLTTLVNRVVGGNFTATPNGKPVTGILVKSTFNGQPVDMLPKFIGTSGPTTNINGVATAGINFLDGGGADALKQGKPANDPNTRQFKLLTHLYGVFGSLTGCSKMGGSVFPNYAGNPSMADTHKFMNINKATMDFFIDQVGQAAVSLGVTPEDATMVGNALQSLFNTQCAKPTSLTPQNPPLPQGFCFGDGCTVANPIDQLSCPNGVGSFPNSKTSSSGTNGISKILKCIPRNGSVQKRSEL
ncbi:hypothetical protein HDV04_001074 [Boothiomyces sp. JEL0838]|nr:hypothetical protein HDV04_001074 [Boothiomyces sp. JEL0838]